MKMLSNPVLKYYAKATVVNSPNFPRNCTVYAMGNTEQEFNDSKVKREAETDLGELNWQLVDSEGNIVKEIR